MYISLQVYYLQRKPSWMHNTNIALFEEKADLTDINVAFLCFVAYTMTKTREKLKWFSTKSIYG